jgi:Protein of unknown function (DUF3040)
MELSRREKEILAQIEGEFSPKETAMAQALNSGPARRLQYSPTVRTWFGLVTLLALGLTMIPLGILLLDLGPVGIGVLTLGIATPWTLLAARLAHRTTTEQLPTANPPAA